MRISSNTISSRLALRSPHSSSNGNSDRLRERCSPNRHGCSNPQRSRWIHSPHFRYKLKRSYYRPCCKWRGLRDYASSLPNTKLQGCISSFGTSSDFLSTPLSVQYGEAPALWSGAFSVPACPNPINDLSWSTDLYVGDPINPNGGGPLNNLGSCNISAADSFFELSGSLPSELTIPASGLTTTYGLPRLEVPSIFRRSTPRISQLQQHTR